MQAFQQIIPALTDNDILEKTLANMPDGERWQSAKNHCLERELDLLFAINYIEVQTLGLGLAATAKYAGSRGRGGYRGGGRGRGRDNSSTRDGHRSHSKDNRVNKKEVICYFCDKKGHV